MHPLRSRQQFYAILWLMLLLASMAAVVPATAMGRLQVAPSGRHLQYTDGTPYECIPVGFYLRDHNRIDRFDDYDARQAAWWSVMAGACGHTYGNNNI